MVVQDKSHAHGGQESCLWRTMVLLVQDKRSARPGQESCRVGLNHRYAQLFCQNLTMNTDLACMLFAAFEEKIYSMPHC